MSAQAPAPADTKTCNACGEAKSTTEFCKDRSRRDGLMNRCRPCDRARHAANKDRTEEHRAEKQLRYKYGLSLACYESILSAQGGGCAICGVTECSSGNRFAVDHDHGCCPGGKACGKCVRGLLCRDCNLTLGHASDSPERLEAAAAYLRGYANGAKHPQRKDQDQ